LHKKKWKSLIVEGGGVMKKILITFIDEKRRPIEFKCDYITVVGNVLVLTFDDKIHGFKTLSFPLCNILRYDCEYTEGG
jgi:hypothetical protein